MRLCCDGCETPIKQGFVKGSRLLCGRRMVQKSVIDRKGNLVLKQVKMRGCS